MLEGLLLAILYLAIIGFVVYLVTTKIPMPDIFKQVIYVIVAIVVIVWLIGLLSGHASLPTFPSWTGSR